MQSEVTFLFNQLPTPSVLAHPLGKWGDMEARIKNNTVVAEEENGA